MKRFRNHDLAGSIRAFESASRQEPRIAPQLWQLGISYYYAANFKKGQQLFETHQRVNPHDVENAAWHFLCVAREQGVDRARELLLKLDTRHDRRVPMREVYALYAGEGSTADVLAAADAAATPRAKMYAHLYLGLYFEVLGEPRRARSHIEQAAVQPLDNHYMHDVAQVHLRQRGWHDPP